MGNLAQTYYALGRHADALAMQERVLDLKRRFLPEDDPEIGEHDMCSDSFFLHVSALIVKSLQCMHVFNLWFRNCHE